MVALCLSGSVLVMTFWPAVRDDHPKIIVAVLSAIVVLNILLAVGCKVSIYVTTYSKFVRFGKSAGTDENDDFENALCVFVDVS